MTRDILLASDHAKSCILFGFSVAEAAENAA